MPSPLAELRDWLAASASRLRARRQFAPLARVTVAQAIAADAIAHSRALAAAGHRSECLDLEAAALLQTALAAGRIDPAELPQLHRALALVRRSAAADHDIADRATIPA